MGGQVFCPRVQFIVQLVDMPTLEQVDCTVFGTLILYGLAMHLHTIIQPTALKEITHSFLKLFGHVSEDER